MSIYLYVSISGEDKVLIFVFNPQTGKLKSQSQVVVTGQPGNMAIDPSGQFIYIARRENHQISTYRRNLDTGELLLVGTAFVEFMPDYLATDRKGRFLLSTYFYAGKVAVQTIGSDGLVGTPFQWLDTAKGVHSIQTDPSNRFVFVPHIAGDGPNVILQFKFNEATGQLTPNTPDRVIPDEGVGPRHFCFHPSMDILYFCNQEGSSVTAYRFDPSTGILRAFQTASTVPENYKGKNWCADIQISPSGKFVYVSNRGHNSIACFSVHSFTGCLTPIEQVATEAEARSFSLDPDGGFLFIAGLESGQLVSYCVNRDTGKLKLFEKYVVGKSPWWVLITIPTR